jgi:hypothetical protein
MSPFLGSPVLLAYPSDTSYSPDTNISSDTSSFFQRRSNVAVLLAIAWTFSARGFSNSWKEVSHLSLAQGAIYVVLPIS